MKNLPTFFYTKRTGKFLPMMAVAILISVYFYVLYRAYNQQFSAFGCFDECFNYIAGYFMVKGRGLYTNIFFNHQPFMAYISYFIQIFLHPSSVYHLVLYHRMFVLFFAFVMDIILILRFRLVGIGFVLFYEITKFYFMGSLFLGESLVVQPLVYMLVVVLSKFTRNKILAIDIILSGIFAWFVIFTREPYILSALLLYGFILWDKKLFYLKLTSISLFFFLCIAALLTLNLQEYVFQVLKYNFQGILKSEVTSNQILGIGLFKIFLYPIFILIEGKQTFLRTILIGIDLLFLVSIVGLLAKTKKILIFLFILLILGISNIRVVPPGWMFYESFHMLPWYGLFLGCTFFLLRELYRNKDLKKIGYTLTFFALILFVYIATSSQSLLVQQLNREKQYLLNFDHYYVFGEAVRLLANEKDTVFVDGGNDLIYWQTKLDSSYKYGINPGSGITKFDLARDEMFRNNPPDFYYYYLCSGKISGTPTVLEYDKDNYIGLNYIDKPCLYIKKSKLSSVPSATWEKLNVLRFYRQ